MAKEDLTRLMGFLKPFPPEVRETVLWLREFVWNIYPEANELIYDNYNALAFGWSPTDRVGHTFCSIAIGRTNYSIHFGFYWGTKITDPEKRLIGNGNQYRYLIIKKKSDLPKTYIKNLLKEAFRFSLSKVIDQNQIMNGNTIVKSVSTAKRTKKSN